MTVSESQQGALEGGKAKAKRGFAVMNPEQQREIARLGGVAAHRSGHAHQFTPEEASAAGKKRHQRRSSGPDA